MSAIAINENNVKIESLSNPTLDQGTSYEVFRNNTTAVEVIVKDVFNKGKKRTQDNDTKMNIIQADVDRLHCKLDTANRSLVNTRRGFQTIVRELRKQTDAANSRETDTQAANLALKLENEKLKLLLDSKMKLLVKVKRELAGIKRLLKVVAKNIYKVPEIPENYELGSDTDYEDFEKDLKRNWRFKFNKKMLDKSNTFDTTASKEHLFENSKEKC